MPIALKIGNGCAILSAVVPRLKRSLRARVVLDLNGIAEAMGVNSKQVEGENVLKDAR
jgi:hypothetical protein